MMIRQLNGSLAAFCALCLLITAPAFCAASALRIMCVDDAVDALVFVDGKLKGECPLDAEVLPGEHHLVVKKVAADGLRQKIFQRMVTMGDGVVKKIEVQLTDELSEKGKMLLAEQDKLIALEKENKEKALALEKEKNEKAKEKARNEQKKYLAKLEENALAGNIDSMIEMGDRYKLGNGVEMNSSISVNWYKKAADAGSETAEFMLSKIYDNAKKEDISDVLKILKMAKPTERIVNISGKQNVLSFVEKDPFFKMESGTDIIKSSYGVTYSSITSYVNSTCSKSGNIFNVEGTSKSDNPGSTEYQFKYVSVLGGLMALSSYSGTGWFSPQPSYEFDHNIIMLAGQPFPLVQDSRFGWRTTSLMNKNQEYSSETTTRCGVIGERKKYPSVVSAEILTPVICYSVTGNSKTSFSSQKIDRLYWSESSGCFLHPKKT